MRKRIAIYVVFVLLVKLTLAQHISEFNSLTQGVQNLDFRLPSTHAFQYIIEDGDVLTKGGNFPDDTDFTGYVPISSSSKFGYLSINSESVPGGVTILDIELNETTGKWITNNSEAVTFSFGLPYAGTVANCSGTVTPWNTIISCEEVTNKDIKQKFPAISDIDLKVDGDSSGYDGYGWAIEIDPATKKVIDQDGGRSGSDKLWAMGNFKHENAVIHNNKRTVYEGADDTKGEGFLFKFVADVEENLSSGNLYVYKGTKQGAGSWLLLDNSTPSEQSSTLTQCGDLGATSFGGIEDVDISPIDGLIYVSVKREDLGGVIERGVIYRFKDTNPLDGTGLENFEIYVGGDVSYDNIPWGNGNDNLVFDDLGNLWVAQDESGTNKRNYIWVVENGHTQQNPKAKIFAQTPFGSEPTGLTFSPDYKYLFMSIQHPDSTNTAGSVPDAFGNFKSFNKDVSLVIARKEYFNKDLTTGNPEIMMTQYYDNEVSNSKWVEVKNISNNTIPAGSYFLGLFDQTLINNMENLAPTASEPIPAMGIGEVLLFKNAGASLPNSSNLGNTTTIITSVCNFNGDDVVLISSTPGKISHTNRRDIIGESGNWGADMSLIRGGDNSSNPEKVFNIDNWMNLSTTSDVDLALTNTNIALGTQEVGPSVWNGTSWNNTTIPDKTRNVEITNTYNATNGNFKAYNLKINSGSNLNFVDNTLNSNNSVIVYGNLNIDNNAIFTIGDTESLVMYDDNASIIGDITKLESSTPRNNPYDITYWSSPVKAATIGTVFEGVTPTRIFSHDQSESTATGPESANDPYGTYWNVWLEASPSDAMISGEGYAAEGKTGTSGIHNISFVGSPNNGNISYTIKGYTDDGLDNDYNLIGNPYPSAIKITDFFDKNINVIDEVIYLWTHASPINGATRDFVSSDYATFNRMGGIASSNGGTEPRDTLGSSQGFFVRAKSSGKIEFYNSMRRANQNNQFFKRNKSKVITKIADKKDRFWLNLTTEKGGFSQILIGFTEKATNGFDSGYDALKLNVGNDISFYSLIENEKYVIQGLFSFSSNQSVSLGFDSKVSPRNFTISIDNIEGALKDASIYLVDQTLNITHDLKESDYQFEQQVQGEFKNRLTLQFVNAALSNENFEYENKFILSHGFESIKISSDISIQSIKVFDILGRLLIYSEPQKKSFELKTFGIKQGSVLFLKATLANGSVVEKKTITF